MIYYSNHGKLIQGGYPHRVTQLGNGGGSPILLEQKLRAQKL
jgi:hypothetical protein